MRLPPGRRAVALIALALVTAACGAFEQRAATAPAPEPLDVVEITIAEIHDALATGRTTCRRVVEAHLERIAGYDEPTGLDAITEVNPRALERAAEIDRALAAGEDLGALHCVPVLVKDNFDTHDLPTTGGSMALRGSLPPDDAFMVRRLRNADAIVLAKTNMAEWAFSPRQTVSSSYGTTANAYDLERVPAGSSGGTASGVAASFGVAGLGSDTGNSIRGPSSHLALFGIRSTLGLTSRDGVIPLLLDRDVAGPMARTVEDGARLFDVLADPDPADPLHALAVDAAGEPRREANYTARLREDGLEGARVGVLRALIEPEDTEGEPAEPIDPRVRALFDQALADLEAAGATVVEAVTIPRWAEHLEADTYCPRFRHDVDTYLASLGEIAPFTSVEEIFEQGLYAEESRAAFEFFVRAPADGPPSSWDPPCPEYPDHPARQAFLADVVAAMDQAGVDALVYPSWNHPPATLERARQDYRGDNSQVVAPTTGMPAVSVPMGFVDGTLPAGLQILGRPYDDGLLIQFAYAYEQATRHRRPPEGFGPLDAAD